MVTDVEIPLFKQPPPRAGVEYPARLLDDFDTGSFGLRYTRIGDDGDLMVILGHPERERVTTLCTVLDFLNGDGNTATRTWARLLTACPDHKTAQDDCQVCYHASPAEWWLDWTPTNKPGAHADKPGYFPITTVGE